MIEYGTIKTFYTKHSYHIFLKKKKKVSTYHHLKRKVKLLDSTMGISLFYELNFKIELGLN